MPWVAEVIGVGRPPGLEAERVHRRRLELPDDGPFEPPESGLFSATLRYPVSDLIGLAASFSVLITLPVAQRERLLAR